MLPQIQNVVSARELFNPNPCRDMWESQQYSQAASCSQGSQHSSMELFSQTKYSQQKGNSLFDGWNVHTNSQQMNEDEPKKYYMKYMSKPPLFPDFDKPPQQKNFAVNYKEFIEGQKRRTAERDEKDVLDNFITLLKDYTKEVKSALDSFKINMDITLTAKAEQMACAADQSTTLISKLKEDLLDNFSELRNEIKENQIIKEEVSKQNEKLVEQSTEVKILRDQLEDYKTRERKGLEKEASLLKREAQLLEKLREMSMQQQALLNRGCSDKNLHINGAGNTCTNLLMEKPGKPPQDGAQISSQINNARMLANEPNKLPPTPHSVPFYSDCRMVGQSNDFPVHHRQINLSHTEPPAPPPPPRFHHPSQLTEPASAPREIMQQLAHYSHERLQELEYNPHSIHPSGFAQRVSERAILDMPERLTVQTIPLQAIVAPVQSVQPSLPAVNSHKELEKSGIIPCTSTSNHEIPNATFKSPNGRLDVSFLARNGRKKQSPVATVLPQVKVKEEYSEDVKKAVPCAKKKSKDDPLNIFMFDLTNDPPGTVYTNERQKPEKEKESNSLVNCNLGDSKSRVSSQGYRTRSKKRSGPLSKDRETSLPQSNGADNTVSSVARKVYKVKSSQALKLRTSPFGGSGTDSDDEVSLCGSTISKPGGTSSTTTAYKDKNTNSAQNNYVTNKGERSFSRNVMLKRTLAFNPSVFDLTDDDVDIQQITECIRRHAQQKKMFKRTRTT